MSFKSESLFSAVRWYIHVNYFFSSTSYLADFHIQDFFWGWFIFETAYSYITFLLMWIRSLQSFPIAFSNAWQNAKPKRRKLWNVLLKAFKLHLFLNNKVRSSFKYSLVKVMKSNKKKYILTMNFTVYILKFWIENLYHT